MAAKKPKKVLPIQSKNLLNIPKQFLDFTSQKYAFPQPDGVKHLFSCRVDGARAYTETGRQTPNRREAVKLVLDLSDDCGNTARSTIFGGLWAWRNVDGGRRITIYAQTSYYNGTFQVDSPRLVSEDEIGIVHPQYANIAGSEPFSGDEVAFMVKRDLILIDEASQIILDNLGFDDSEFLAMYGCSPQALLLAIHTPKTQQIGEDAIVLVEQISTEMIIRRAETNSIVSPNAASQFSINSDDVKRLCAGLPFPLTGDQSRALDEIISDLNSAYPMRRMLAGDVGTGKSLVFMIPAVLSILYGKSCAIVTPNQLLVSQLAREIIKFFPGTPVQVIKTGGKIKPDGGVVVGTTSVLFAALKGNVEFDLVVTDEEHKFSIEQKAAIVSSHTNFLKATATPIPRSIALIACDGMALSTIEECPVVKNIISLVIGPDKKIGLLDFIKKKAKEGQIAIVYPAVLDSKKLKSIQENAGKWEKIFPEKVAVLHGQMGQKTQQAALDSMLSGEKDILVATTAIELGVTLPDLKMMVVVNPEMFGVSQLHQLRGRVARHGGDGYFIMYSPENNIAEESLNRLNLVKTISNGFQLAEKDMEVRGFGDLDISGGSQTGQGKIVFRNINVSMKKVLFAMASRKKSRVF